MTAEHLTVAFSLDLTNNGPVAATGLMIRIALGQGSAMQEEVIARFFDGAGGSVLRDDIELAPGAGERFHTEVTLPRTAIEPLMVAGKPMLVRSEERTSELRQQNGPPFAVLLLR